MSPIAVNQLRTAQSARGQPAILERFYVPHEDPLPDAIQHLDRVDMAVGFRFDDRANAGEKRRHLTFRRGRLKRLSIQHTNGTPHQPPGRLRLRFSGMFYFSLLISFRAPSAVWESVRPTRYRHAQAQAPSLARTPTASGNQIGKSNNQTKAGFTSFWEHRHHWF